MGTLDAVKERFATSDAAARMHRRVFRASHGRVGGSVEGRPVLLLATTGRRSGQRREVVIVHHDHDGRYLVVPSNAAHPERPPAWWCNLQAHPDAEVLVGGRWHHVVAATLPDDERDALWPTLTTMNPHWAQAQQAAARRFPVVALTPVGADDDA